MTKKGDGFLVFSRDMEWINIQADEIDANELFFIGGLLGIVP
jgi:hypothetical protein